MRRYITTLPNFTQKILITRLFLPTRTNSLLHNIFVPMILGQHFKCCKTFSATAIFFQIAFYYVRFFYWSDMNNFYEAFHVKFVILSIQKAFTRFHCIFVHFCTVNVEIKFLENRDFSMCLITRIRVRKLLKMTYLLTSFYKNAQGFKLGIKRILKEEILSFHLMQKNCCHTQKSGSPLKSPSSSRL